MTYSVWIVAFDEPIPIDPGENPINCEVRCQIFGPCTLTMARQFAVGWNHAAMLTGRKLWAVVTAADARLIPGQNRNIVDCPFSMN